jgi:hypothetical protein
MAKDEKFNMSKILDIPNLFLEFHLTDGSPVLINLRNINIVNPFINENEEECTDIVTNIIDGDCAIVYRINESPYQVINTLTILNIGFSYNIDFMGIPKLIKCKEDL